MITVGNIKNYGKPLRPWEVYIGRKNMTYGVGESPLHNKFKISSVLTREQAVAAYAREFDAALKLKGDLQFDGWAKGVPAEVERLTALYLEHQKLTLICWCAPLACHGHVIQAYIEANA